jgi:hypothetical protein
MKDINHDWHPLYCVVCIAAQVSYNAARADKARLQQLEVEVARFNHRAETAESEKLELQAQLQHLQVCTHTPFVIKHAVQLFRTISSNGWVGEIVLM